MSIRRLLLCVVVVLTAGSVYAADIYVNPDGSGDYTTIQAAFVNASDGDVIIVACARYTENLSFTGMSVTLRGESAGGNADTVIESAATNTPVLSIAGPAAKGTVIQDLCFEGGYGEYGGVYIDSTEVTFSNCYIIDNEGSEAGGIYADSSDVTVADCTMYGNTAAYGGAMGFYDCGDVTVSGCRIRSNSADVYGGAVYLKSVDSADIKNCSFTTNSASYGGAINSACPSVSVSDCTFSGNEAELGGAIFLLSSDMNGEVIDVFNCNFEENQVSYQGGAISCIGFGMNCSNCKFVSNSIVTSGSNKCMGGAVYLYSGDEEIKSVFNNCEFRSNTITSGDSAYGGAIYNFMSSETITNCTFRYNFANDEDGYGGAIYNIYCSPVICNSIFRQNESTAQVVNEDSGDIPVFKYCLVYGSGGSGDDWDTTLGEDGGGNIDRYPYFVSDTDLHLSATSPCIDAGMTELAGYDVCDIDSDGSTLEWAPYDADGNNRFSNATDVEDGEKTFASLVVVDMGAYEYQGDTSIGGVEGDLNGDGEVDLSDFVIMAGNWLVE